MTHPRAMEPGVLYTQRPDGSWVPIGVSSGPPELWPDPADGEPLAHRLPGEVISIGVAPEHVDNLAAVFGEAWERGPDVSGQRAEQRDILDRIDEAVDDWEGDAASWRADGSHEHDPPEWTALDASDGIERYLARLGEAADDAAEVINEQLAAMQRQLVLWGELFIERMLGDLSGWRPMGIVQAPHLRRAAAGQALARWNEERERARRRTREDDRPDDSSPPADPRERALWLRQRRGTGPAGPRLDGRRR